jgi:hypothetical protein
LTKVLLKMANLTKVLSNLTFDKKKSFFPSLWEIEIQVKIL